MFIQNNKAKLLLLLISSVLLLSQQAFALPQGKEANCTDGIDNDGDTVTDCGDADCYKDSPACKPDGGPEGSDARCSDWIDNDMDGAADCEDDECKADHITACQGSWNKKKGGAGIEVTSVVVGEKSAGQAQGGQGGLGTSGSFDPRERIGMGNDKDGERNDDLCSDGIDNDNDGKTDCQDVGCLFDDSVTVCRNAPDMRFSVVAQLRHSYTSTNSLDTESKKYEERETVNDTRFSRLQLRTFGPIPQIQNSFYLISILAERTPRLTYAFFSIPIGKSGHAVNVNSGAAGLSQAQAVSIHKQLLIERTNLFRSFEQFNSAAIEFTGPIPFVAQNRMYYRAFFAGGSGRYDGNVGGRQITNTKSNYPFMLGGQLGFNLVGYYSRFDTPFLYTPVPLTVGILAGIKYDRREQEEYNAQNVQLGIRWRYITLNSELYAKQELNFKVNQLAYLVQLGVLAVPKHIMLGFDFGSYLAGAFKTLPEGGYSSLVREPRDEMQYRIALHWYFFRNIGVASFLYSYHFTENGYRNQKNGLDENEIRQAFNFVVQYRF